MFFFPRFTLARNSPQFVGLGGRLEMNGGGGECTVLSSRTFPE